MNNHVMWLTNEKKQRPYNKAKSTQLQSDWSAYKDIKKHVQRECRRTHDNYVSNPDNKNSNEKFC